MSSTRVLVTGDRRVIEPVGWDKVWSFTRRLQFTLGHVRGRPSTPA